MNENPYAAPQTNSTEGVPKIVEYKYMTMDQQKFVSATSAFSGLWLAGIAYESLAEYDQKIVGVVAGTAVAISMLFCAKKLWPKQRPK